MAASYIRIAIVVLAGIALLTFLLGFAVGARARSSRHGLWAALGIGSVFLILFLIGSRVLPVTGPLITRQLLALWFEIQAALLCGGVLGQLLKQEKKGVLVSLSVPLALLSLAAIGIQVQNVQSVLDVLQQAGLLKPKDDYKPETNKTCPENLKGLYNAFEQYVELNDKLPDATNWEDNTDLTSRVPQDEWLHCPAVSNGRDAHWGYAYNDALAGQKLNLNGKPLKTLPDAAKLPLLYDSSNLNKNAHDAGTSLPKPGRHGGRNNILYLDGHVEAVAP